MSSFPPGTPKGMVSDSTAASSVKGEVDEPAHAALITRTSADAMNAGIPSSLASGGGGGAANVLLSGTLKKRDGLMVKKWIDVYVELRENSLTCFGSADKSQIIDTVVIDAGIEFVFTEKDKMPALILKKSSARGPLAKELVLGLETESQRDQWAETLDACCLKARSHVEAKRMVQEEAAARARKEAELQRKALEDAARSRQQERAAQGAATGAVESVTFDLDKLDGGSGPLPSTPFRDGENQATTATPSSDGVPVTPSSANPLAANAVLQPSTPAQPPDGKGGGRMSFMGSRMRSAFANVPSVSRRGKEGKDEGEREEGQGREQLEESIKDMMLAEANHQLRQSQEDLQKERDQTAKLRDQVQQLMSEDSGLQEMLGRMEAAEEAARKAEELAVAAKKKEAEALEELGALQKAAAASANKKASEAAERDLKQSREEDEEEAAQRLLASLKEEVLRLQQEMVRVQDSAKASVDRAEQRAAAAEDALVAAVRVTSVAGGSAPALSDAVPSRLQPEASIAAPPGSVQEFCDECGLGKYAELMIENEVDVDVLPDLGDEDWEELGVSPEDLPGLLEAVGRLRGALAAQKALEAQMAQGGSGSDSSCAPMSAHDCSAGAADTVARIEEVESRERVVQRREPTAIEHEREVERQQQELKRREGAVAVHEKACESRERDVQRREQAAAEYESEVERQQQAVAAREQACVERSKELEMKEALLEARQQSQESCEARLEQLQRELDVQRHAADEREQQMEEREREVQQDRQSLSEESQKLDVRKQELEAEREQTEKEIEQARREVEEAKMQVEAANKGIGICRASASSEDTVALRAEAVAEDLSARMVAVDEEREELNVQLAESAARLGCVIADARVREEAYTTSLRDKEQQAARALGHVRGLLKDQVQHFAVKLQVLQDGIDEVATEVGSLQHGSDVPVQLLALQDRLASVEAEAARERMRVEEEAALERHALEQRLAAVEADRVWEREDGAQDEAARVEAGDVDEAIGAARAQADAAAAGVQEDGE